MLSYKLKLEDVYCYVGMEVVDLTSKFNRASIENLDVRYFCIDMKVDDKMYNVKNENVRYGREKSCMLYS